jgi:hypothetical protein
MCVCKQCSGWGESCSPDWYADYCDPNAGINCPGYELKIEYKITYIKYNNKEMHDSKFAKTIEKAEALKISLEKLTHISDVRITKIVGNDERLIDKEE